MALCHYLKKIKKQLKYYKIGGLKCNVQNAFQNFFKTQKLTYEN